MGEIWSSMREAAVVTAIVFVLALGLIGAYAACHEPWRPAPAVFERGGCGR